MNIPSFNNDFALLALFLSPWKNEETVQNLSNCIQKGTVEWGRLLYMANLHYSAPLWFCSLQKDGLLSLLPSELQIYLKHLYQENLERQNDFRQALMEIVSKLHDLEIPVILLKGAATFCDDLYEAAGARMMGDIDFLVKMQHLELVKKIMWQLGYDEQADCFGKPSGISGSNLPHHLPRYLKPGTPVAVEVHFQIAQAQAGRVLQTDLSWANKEMKTWEGLNPYLLTPTYRVLHTTVHALVPKAAYASSILPLNQMAEFAYIVRRYSSFINWHEWLINGASQGLSRQFRVYLTLVHRLMGMPFPKQVRQVDYPNLHVARISNAGNNRANDLSGCKIPKKTAVEKIKNVSIRLYIKLFIQINTQAYIWRNSCYKKGLRNIPQRLSCLFVINFRRIVNLAIK
jgi:hypothetical protein